MLSSSKLQQFNYYFVSFCFAVFVFSGLIKSTIGDFVKFDFTMWFGLICICFLLFRAINGKVHYSQLLILFTFLLFFSYYLLMTIKSLSPNYASAKVVGLAVIFICVMFPMFVRVHKKVFFATALAISLLACLVSLYARNLLDYSILQLYFRQLYLPAGTALGAVLLFYLCQKERGFVRTLSVKQLLVFVSLFGILMATGARGPILFFVLCFILYFFSVTKELSFKTLAYIGLGVLAGFFALLTLDIGDSIFTRSINRLAQLFADNKGNSVNQRLEYFHTAYNMFLSSPLIGEGVGSFSFFYASIDARVYPHNFILELLSEVGVIGFLLYSLLLLQILYQFKHKKMMIIVMLYFLLNMMKSGAIEDHRIFFGLAAVSFAYLYSNRKNQINKPKINHEKP